MFKIWCLKFVILDTKLQAEPSISDLAQRTRFFRIKLTVLLCVLVPLWLFLPVNWKHGPEIHSGLPDRVKTEILLLMLLDLLHEEIIELPTDETPVLLPDGVHRLGEDSAFLIAEFDQLNTLLFADLFIGFAA